MIITLLTNKDNTVFSIEYKNRTRSISFFWSTLARDWSRRQEANDIRVFLNGFMRLSNTTN